MSTESDAHAGAGEPTHDQAEGATPKLVETGPETVAEATAEHPEHVVEHAAEAPVEAAPEAVHSEAVHEAAVEAEAVHAAEHPLEHESAAEPAVEHMPAEAAPQAPAEVVPEAPAVAAVAPEAAAEARYDHAAAEPQEEKGAKDEFFEIAKTIFYALLIALVLRVLFFQPFTIPSASMEPNLYQGDYIIVSKWNYGYSKHSIPFSPPLFSGRIMDKGPQRGDIVVFKLPRDLKIDYIKRVIGLPGDKVQMINDQLYINGAPVPYKPLGKIKVDTYFGDKRDAMLQSETLPNGVVHQMQDFSPYEQADNTEVFTVPAGQYFMMGDNRDDSVDSRFSPEQNGVGFVPAENLVGKAQVVLFSWYPGASLWKPWTWFTKVRFSRFFHTLK